MKMNDSGKGPQKKTWANFVGEINFLKYLLFFFFAIMCPWDW